MSIASEIQRIKNNIAAAYSACESKGANMPQLQNSNNLADTINSISQGGISVNKKDVNFFDYDGTLLYSYTFSEAAELSVLPNLPTHTGLIAQEWNWTLSQIQSDVNKRKTINVGCNLDTDDGSTCLFFYVHKGTRIPTLALNFCIAAATSVVVYWGDGTSSSYTNSGSSALYVQATKTDYAEAPESGELCVKICGGNMWTEMVSFQQTMFSGGDKPVLTRVNLGSNCIKLNDYTFYNCNSLSSVTVSNTIRYFGEDCFYGCGSLRFFTVPKSFTGLSNGVFQRCGLRYLSIPKSISAIGSDAFHDCENLLEFVIPDGVSTLSSSVFYNCNSLLYAALPANITTIRSDAMRNCGSLYVLDLSAYTDPTGLPTLRDSNAFSNTPSYLKILVADQVMLNAFSSATNWSYFASKMQIKGTST